MANDAEPQQEKMGHRDWLALLILVFSILGVLALAITIVVRVGDAQMVMTATLPLLGSWVGTILAFYFSKDNFAAATRSVTEMSRTITAQEKLQATLAKDKMIPRARMFSIPVTSGQTLKEILTKLTEQKIGFRIPFLEQQDFPKYVIHRSVIDQFLVQRALNPTSPPIALEDLTLEDLISDPEWQEKIERSIDTVREDATLADVKVLMEKNPHCQDVFVTKGGGRNEPVLGWITNAIVEENTKL
jgi:hypothetical protein